MESSKTKEGMNELAHTFDRNEVLVAMVERLTLPRRLRNWLTDNSFRERDRREVERLMASRGS